ncbi:MAG TPA: hypothetical protein DCM62_10580 [Bacteroidales bacterium]|nr:hypothetical protein [Bacteroidales bacterium]
MDFFVSNKLHHRANAKAFYCYNKVQQENIVNFIAPSLKTTWLHVLELNPEAIKHNGPRVSFHI